MLTVGLVWNGQALDRTPIEINKEDEISLAHFVCDFKEPPLLDSFSDLPLSVEGDSHVLSLRLTLRFLHDERKLGTKRDDVHGLSGAERRRGLVRLAVTCAGGQKDN